MGDTQTPLAPQPLPQAPQLSAPPPVGLGRKESGPAGETVGGINMAEASKVAKEEGDEFWDKYAEEIKLEKEIAEMGGMEKVEAGEVAVPAEVAKEAGIREGLGASGEQLEKEPAFAVSGVNLTDDQLVLGMAKPTSSGFRWLVEWFIYQLLKAHFLLRRVKGKLVREKKS